MQCDTIISPTKLPFPPPSPPPHHPPTKLSFTYNLTPPFPPLKARATLNNGTPSATQKPISEMSFYELLGIPHHVELPQIKLAYKQLVLKYHPDVSPPELVDEYTDRFIRVQEAYEILSDPRKRALYDRDMARGLHLAFSVRKKMYNVVDEHVYEGL